MKAIGFIGLGIMGRPVAANLLAAGYEVFLKTRRDVPPDLISAGGKPCNSGREVAEKADIIITMVPDTPQVEEVLFGPGGVAEGLGSAPRKVVVDMSSISPIATKDFARRINEAGHDYLDAPVSGGEVGAKAFDGGRFKEAIALFSDMSLSDTFDEFLTLPAYKLID